jgi:hypothetical protein
MTLRYALQAGLDEAQVRAFAGGQLERLLAREDPVHVGPAPGGSTLVEDPILDRVYGYLMSAAGQMMAGIQPEEILALAALACEVGDDAPQAAVCSSVLALLEERKEYAAAGHDDGRPARFAPGIHLIVVAAGVTRTPDVPLPPDPVPVDVAERTQA